MIPESAQMLGDVGAGIQVTTNMTQLLLRWCLCPAFHTYGIEPTTIVLSWYGTGKRLGCKRSVPHMVHNYGVPHSKFNYVVYIVAYTM